MRQQDRGADAVEQRDRGVAVDRLADPGIADHGMRLRHELIEDRIADAAAAQAKSRVDDSPGCLSRLLVHAPARWCTLMTGDGHREHHQASHDPCRRRREDAAVGGFVGVLLHETGHATFHLLGIPIFGREEDAADAVGSYVALQFGPATARRILSGRAFVWRARELAGNSWGPSRRFADCADEHGTNAQRFYNTLCIALGSDEVEGTTTFAEFKDLLPAFRQGHCRYEYQHVKRSFAHFVVPHLDMERVAKVRAREWLRSEDGTDIPALAGLAPGGRSAMDSDLLLGISLVVAVLALPIIAIVALWLAIAGRRRIRKVEQRLTALQEGRAVTADAAPGQASSFEMRHEA